MDRRERGGLAVFLTLWSGEPFYRWKGSSLSVWYSVLHGLKDQGLTLLPTTPQGRIHVYWGLLWPQDLSRTPLGGSEGHHGTCFALLLTGRACSGVPGWRMGAALSVEVGPGSWWGLVMVNMLICSSGYVNSTTVGTAV